MTYPYPCQVLLDYHHELIYHRHMETNRNDIARVLVVVENSYKRLIAEVGEQMTWNDLRRATAWSNALAEAEAIIGRPLTSVEVTKATFLIPL